MIIEFIHGDMRSVLADALPDVMIADPPYSEHVHKSATSCGTPGARPSGAVKGAAHRDLGFEHLADDLRVDICVLAARTRRWSCIFTDTESVGEWQRDLSAAGAAYIRSVPWVRWSMPQLSGDRPPQGHEMIVISWGTQGGKKSWNGPGNLTHFAHTCMRGKNKHKAQKPLDLVLDLVEFFSDAGELVVDPCSGSGTTGLACKLLGRNFVGAEVSADWIAVAKARLTASMHDDAERHARYLEARAARAIDMDRMATNTARIAENRLRHGEADEPQASLFATGAAK